MMREETAAPAPGRGAVSLEPPGWTPAAANDGVPTHWVRPETLRFTLDELAGAGCPRPFLLLDLFCLDDALGGHESERALTIVYVLLRPAPFAALRLKVRLEGELPVLPSAAPLFSNAPVYERALTEGAGVRFEGDASGVDLRSLDVDDADDELDVERALPRVLALETLLGVTPPPRADAIRVLRAEVLRVASHLSWYAAFLDDVGARAAASFAPVDVRRALEAVHALGAGDASGLVVGGVRDELPSGWRELVEGFVSELLPRVQGYAELTSSSPRFCDASKGVSPLDARMASSWAITGPLLRAAGLACDLRKERPYCGYERYGFQVPVGVHGDVYDRARVRLEELRESLRILAQCAADLPAGPIRVAPPSAFVPGEALAAVEGSRGVCACYVASDGASLFVRERTPGLAHRQALAAMSQGYDARARATIASSVDLPESRA